MGVYKIFLYIMWIAVIFLAAYFKQYIPVDFHYLYGFAAGSLGLTFLLAAKH